MAAALVAAGARPAPLPGDLLPENDTPWSYVAPPFEGHCLQTFRLYLPEGEAPPDGWPVVVAMILSGFAASEDVDSLVRGTRLAAMVDAGLAVVAARATVSQPLDNAYWSDECGTAPSFPGHGLFKAPGVVPTDLVADGITPYDDPEWHMAEKDAVMALQHVRYLARQEAPFTLPDFPVEQQAALAQLDPERVAVHGRSAGAMISLWASVGPERSLQAPFVGLGGQHAERARPDVAALGVPGTWWPIYSEELVFPQPHFGLDGHSEDIGTFVGDTLLSDRIDNSALSYEDAARSGQLPIYLQYGDKSNVTDVSPSHGCDLPLCYKGQGTEGLGDGFQFVHASWSGYAWKYLHPGRTRLAVTTQGAFDQKPRKVNATAFVGDDGEQAQTADMVEWLAQALLEPEPWDDELDALFVPGDRIEGSLAPGGEDVVRLAFDGVEGSRLRVKASRLGGGDLEPGLRLLDPDDVELLDVAPDGKSAHLDLVLPAGGRHVVELRDGSGAGGAWRVQTRTRRRLSFDETLLVDHEDGAEGVRIPAAPGTLVRRVDIRRIQPKDLAPLVEGEPQGEQLQAALVDLGGPYLLRLGDKLSVKKGGKRLLARDFELPFAGDWTLRVDTADGLPTWVRARTRLQLPRGRRTLQLDG